MPGLFKVVLRGLSEPIGPKTPQDPLEEADASIWVDPIASTEEVTSVYDAKVNYAHPHGAQDPEDRTKRLDWAFEAMEKARQER